MSVLLSAARLVVVDLSCTPSRQQSSTIEYTYSQPTRRERLRRSPVSTCSRARVSSAQLLGVDVQQLARARPLVADHLRPLGPRSSRAPGAPEHRVARSSATGDLAARPRAAQVRVVRLAQRQSGRLADRAPVVGARCDGRRRSRPCTPATPSSRFCARPALLRSRCHGRRRDPWPRRRVAAANISLDGATLGRDVQARATRRSTVRRSVVRRRSRARRAQLLRQARVSRLIACSASSGRVS